MESERWEMGRDKRRLKFLESWHIDEYESWFSDMARKGWYLKRVGILFVRFTKGEPKPTRYRIAAAGSPRRPGQAGSGWNDVCPFDNSGSLSVWACAEGPDTPEFPIVPGKNVPALRHFHTEYLALALLTAASAFLLAGSFLLLMLADGTPFLSFLQSDLFPPFFALILFCFAGYALRGTTAIRALGKNPSPRPLARRGASWRKKRFLTKIAYLLPLLMLIALAAVSLTPPSFAGETRTLPADSGGLPLVRLSEIEQSPRLERKSEDAEGRAYDIRNYYSRHRTPLSLCWYESLETGIVDSSSSPDGRIYSPSIRTAMYRLTFPCMAEKTVSELLHKNIETSFAQNRIQTENPGFDELFVYEIAGGYQLFASKGRGVLYLSYYGEADADRVVSVAFNKIRLTA